LCEEEIDDRDFAYHIAIRDEFPFRSDVFEMRNFMKNGIVFPFPIFFYAVNGYGPPSVREHIVLLETIIGAEVQKQNDG